ncbi:MAG: hypothetical protein QOD60_406 [Solirubrobacterales bacterium]|jgi:hypothetical protein|nr:hypothetical protein [Solirubrobacterales bacterium]
MSTLVEQLSSDSIEGGRFALAFTVGAIVGSALAAALVALIV